MGIAKKAYADISGQFIDFTVYPLTTTVEYFSGVLYFPPTSGIFGISVGEKFAGQTITTTSANPSAFNNYDRINGLPSVPLVVEANAIAEQNLAVHIDTSLTLPVISGCGIGNTEVKRIGEGTVAILFESPVSEVGFMFGGVDDSAIYFQETKVLIKAYFYSVNGDLIGTIEWRADEIAQSPSSVYNNTLLWLKVGVETTEGAKIKGIVIETYDVNGHGLFNLTYNALCEGVSLTCSYNEETFDYDSPVFPLIEDIAVSTAITFSNQILRNNNVSEQRIIEHEYPIRTYSLSRSIMKTSDMTALRNFFHDIKGALGEFLYNDQSDNIATKDDLVLADGVATWGQLVKNPDNLQENQYQLCKAYQVGDSIHYRPITNPSNLVIYDGLTVVDATHEGGLIEGLADPTSGSYRASFTFVVPVRMEGDLLEDKLLTKTVDGTKIYSLDQLNLVEVKKNLKFYPQSINVDELNHEIAIDLRWGQVSETKYTTEIFSKGSGQESRRQRQRLPEYFVNLQPKGIVLPKQMSYLIALWLCSKGGGYSFDYTEAVSEVTYPSRFNSPALSYSNQSVKLIFEVSGLQLKLFKDGTITDNGAYYVKVGNDWEKTQSLLDAPVLHFANCLKITTSGGCVYAFTSHDKDIKIGDDIYKASTAISPSAYSSNPSMSVNSEEFRTVFLQFDEDRFYSGLFKNATVETAIVDWQDIPSLLSDGIDHQKGIVGKITSNGHYYSFEFLSLGASKLNQTYSPKTTSICRHVFGDDKCQYEKKEICVTVSLTRTPTPLAIPVQIPLNNAFVIGNYRYGYVILSDGTRHTINFLEIYDDNLWINLFNPLLQWPAQGDIIFINEGCLRTLKACQEYNNTINFGAIPTTGNWVPGSYEYLSPSISR